MGLFKNIFGWLCLITILSISKLYGQCPTTESIAPCICAAREDLQIWCTHSDLPQVLLGLQKVGTSLTSQIDELIVENNYLPSLPGKTFQNVNILRLMLRHNGVERLSGSWLDSQEKTLMEIILIENELKVIPPESLLKLQNLQAITIQSHNLKRLPIFAGLPRLKYINIQASSLKQLPTKNFYNLPTLEKLYLKGSIALQRLDENVFYNLPKLSILEIAHCGLQFIHMRALSILPSLQELSFEHNRIKDASLIGRVTRDLPQLMTLNLNHNELVILNEASFVDLPKLTRLFLSYNKISEIHHGAFHRVPNLRLVELNYNRIHRIHPESFLQNSGTGIEDLLLIGNQITHVEEFKTLLESLPSLKFLDFSLNNLGEIPRGVLRGHPNLERLHLNENNIKYIDEGAFTAMPSLRELHLRNNSLDDQSEGPFWNLPALKGLDLSNNYFRHIHPKLLYNIESLRRIDLSNNAISNIDPISFLQTPLLEYVNISQNRIASIHPATFRSLMHLYELDVNNNRLVEFVPGLPRRIEFLYLRSNQITHLPLPPSPDIDLHLLKHLDLTSNGLQHIPIGVMKMMPNLKILLLKKNGISILEDKTFMDLNNLELLDISDNQLLLLQENCFYPLIKLKHLNLHGNILEQFSLTTLSNNLHLTHLDLSKNKLKLIEGELPTDSKLEFLNISMNRLTDFPKTLQSFPNLKVVDISVNHMKKFNGYISTPNKLCLREFRMPLNKINELLPGTFENINDIETINLEGNNIERVHSGAIKLLPNLNSIYLSRNRIENLPDESFSYLPQVRIIELQSNRLRDIAPMAFYEIPLLQYLNLSHNHLTDLSNSGLKQLTSLEVLDLSFNRINRIDSSCFQYMEWLIELHIDNNHLCFIGGKPFQLMPRLKVLSIKNNRLVTVAEPSFAVLRNNIAIFDIDGNPLACDCRILWLKSWLQEASAIGPKCSNGIFVKDLPLSKNDCNNKEIGVQENSLLCDRASSEESNIDLYSPLKDRMKDSVNDQNKNSYKIPSPEESDYFYDEYVDLPVNETGILQGLDENNFSDIYLKKKNQKPGKPNITTSLTFFGMPIPKINIGNLWNTGRKNEWPKNTDNSNNKYENPPYDQPKFETGGFMPMLPTTAGGFTPIVNGVPFDNSTIYVEKIIPTESITTITTTTTSEQPLRKEIIVSSTDKSVSRISVNKNISHIMYTNKTYETNKPNKTEQHENLEAIIKLSKTPDIEIDDRIFLITTDTPSHEELQIWTENPTVGGYTSLKPITSNKITTKKPSMTTRSPNILSAVLAPNDVPHQISGMKRPATITKVNIPQNEQINVFDDTYLPINNREGKTRFSESFEPNIQKILKEKGMDWYYLNYNKSDLEPYIGPGVVKANSAVMMFSINYILLVTFSTLMRFLM